MFDTQYESIPCNLEDLQPGPELGGVLACIDVDRLSGHDLIIVLRAQDRMRSYWDAERYRTIAGVVDALAQEEHSETPEHDAAYEIRAALRLTRRASDAEVEFALDLRRRLPSVWESLATGDIDYRRARTIALGTIHLSIGAARDIVDRVIDQAANLTTGQLRARVDRLAMETDTDRAKDRYEYAVTQRRVFIEPTSEGTANLIGLDLAPHRVTAVSRRINHLARSLKTKDETRTMDQLRADVFLDLLSGKERKGPKAVVNLNVDLDTLAALSDHPGELNGYGPVIADIARQVTADEGDGEWRYTVTAPATGKTVANGLTRRRPTAADRREIEARNPTCVFPGCRMPSVDCDIDHRQRWADGGPTTVDNQAPLCRHDHPTKDKKGWRYRPLPNGDYQWTSRLGHTYTTSGTPP
jgi:hypothetical protein